MSEYAIKCKEHGICHKPWIICVHVAADAVPKYARRIDDDELAGEVLCATCAELCDSEGPPQGDLRMACEPCVLDRWKLQDAS
jgi:hypothetical protein